MSRASFVWSARAAALGAAMVMVSQLGCIGKQFREAALPEIQSGMELILDGLLEGVFAAIEPETATGSGDTAAADQAKTGGIRS